MGEYLCLSIHQGVTMSLHEKKCIPCEKGIPPLKGDKLQDLYKQLDPSWKLVNDHHLVREYKFKNFKQALDFTNKIGELAESVQHHPDILLAWGKVEVTIYTHKINGLSESDFFFAAKCDRL